MYSNRLNVFITLAQYLSFSETAKHLYLTQSAVSRSIAELERELGVKLFERTKKGCVLTLAGEVFLTEAYRIISLSETAKSKLQKIASGQSGVLNIGFPTELMVDPLAECIRNFSKRYPNVELNFLEYSSVAVSMKLLSGELDLALGRYEALIKKEEFEWRRLFRDQLLAIVPSSHRFAKEKSVTYEKLSKETIVIVSREVNPGYYDVIQKLFLSKGFMPIFNTASNERMSAVFKVRTGTGITLLTKQFMNTHKFDDLLAIPLDEENAFFDNGIAWRKNETNPIVRLFLDEIDEYLKRLPNGVIEN